MNPTNYLALCAGTALPRAEQLRLASHALGKPRAWFLAHDTDTLTQADAIAIQTAFARRLAGEPIAYIEGYREFYGLVFTVSPAVLIPRPETELLVDTVVKLAPPHATVLDLGTGSGAIAISIAHTRRDCEVHAVELSEQALTIAQLNASKHTPNLQLHKGSWCDALPHCLAKPYFDVIVSNPPYINASDTHLTQGDLRFEPAGALTDFADGLSHYRTIAQQAQAWLKPEGLLVFEHGYEQGHLICELLNNLGYLHVTQHHDKDEQAHPRMVTAIKPLATSI